MLLNTYFCNGLLLLSICHFIQNELTHLKVNSDTKIRPELKLGKIEKYQNVGVISETSKFKAKMNKIQTADKEFINIIITHAD